MSSHESSHDLGGWWRGQPLASSHISLLVFCCRERDEDRPKALLGSAATQDEAVAVRPHDLGRFLASHGQATFVCHDVARWHWLLDGFFRANGDEEAIQTLWSLSANCRLVDLSLLEQQIESWHHEDQVRPPTFFELAKRYAKRERLPEEQELRRAAIESISAGIDEAPSPVLAHAASAASQVFLKRRKEAEKAIASLDAAVLQPAIPNLQPSESYRKAHDALWQHIKRRQKSADQPSGVSQTNEDGTVGDHQSRFGLLGIGIDVQAAIALGDPGRPPLTVDPEELPHLQRVADQRFSDACKQLHGNSQTQGCFIWDDAAPRFGPAVACSADGLPIAKLKPLKTWLRQTAQRLKDVHNFPADAPLGEDQPIWSDPERWDLWPECDLLLSAWRDLHRFAILRRTDSCAQSLRPNFEVWPAIRSRNPNLLAMRSLGVRVFRPRPGRRFVVGRLVDLKLRTFAAICRHEKYSLRGRLLNYFLPKFDDPFLAISQELRDRWLRRPIATSADQEPDAEFAGSCMDKPVAAHDRGVEESANNESDVDGFREAVEILFEVLPLGLSEPLLARLLQLRFGISPSSADVEWISQVLKEEVAVELADFLRDDVLERLARTIGVSNAETFKRLVLADNALSPDDFARNELLDKRKANRLWQFVRNSREEARGRDFPSDDEIKERVFSYRLATPAGRLIPPLPATAARRRQWLMTMDEVIKAVVYALAADNFCIVAQVGEQFVLEVPEAQVTENLRMRIEVLAYAAQQKVMGPTFAAPCSCVFQAQW